MSNLSDWIHDDICWCISECDNTDCFRNLKNRLSRNGYFTAAELKGTDDCLLKEDETDEMQ